MEDTLKTKRPGVFARLFREFGRAFEGRNETANLGRVNLSPFVHDAFLVAVDTDDARGCSTLALESHLSQANGWPSNTRYLLSVSEVSRLNAVITYSKLNNPGLRTEESLSWAELQERVLQETQDWEILSGKVHFRPDYVSLSLGGLSMSTNRDLGLEVEGSELRCFVEGVGEKSIDELVTLGRTYWDNFGRGEK